MRFILIQHLAVKSLKEYKENLEIGQRVALEKEDINRQ
jgi:hypothetical protein